MRMARPGKSFSDLQRELITTQVEQRRASAREAAAVSRQATADDLAIQRPPAKLSVVKD
jgi:hypothetical protein